jgi:hypothetical protein
LSFEFGDIFESGVEEIFLSQVADVRANFAGDVQMVVDDEADAGSVRDGQNLFHHAPVTGFTFLVQSMS